MKVVETEIPGLLIIEPKVFGDERGFFLEAWQQRRYAEVGVVEHFVQDNLAYSRRGVLRHPPLPFARASRRCAG